MPETSCGQRLGLQSAPPCDFSGKLARLDEQAHLMSVRQRGSEHIGRRRLEAKSLPEAARPAGEQPGGLGSFVPGRIKCEARQRESSARSALVGLDGDAANQHVPAIAAQLIPRTPDDGTVRVELDPEPHIQRVDSAQGEIGVPKERPKRIDMLVIDTMQ